MKNILIPTDFSHPAGYAVNYGGHFAAMMNASVTLFHAFHFPVLTEEAVLEQSVIENWEKDNEEQLQKIADHIKQFNPGMPVDVITRLGFAEEEILLMAGSGKYDMVIMGSKGLGSLGDTLFGGVTTDIIRKINIPVLIIPSEVYYQPVKRIAFACNNHHLITEKAVKAITSIVNACHAKLFIVDIIREPVIPLSDSYIETDRMKNYFHGIIPSVHIVENEKVVNGINAFADENSIDMIIMIPEKHNLFERMFTEIHTRHMTKDTQKPLLIIPHD